MKLRLSDLVWLLVAYMPLYVGGVWLDNQPPAARKLQPQPTPIADVAVLLAPHMPQPMWLARMIVEEADSHAMLVASVIVTESAGDSMAVGPRTPYGRAVGLGQIMPSVWEGVFPECGDNLQQARTNVCYTVRILRHYLQKAETDTVQALNGYWGTTRYVSDSPYTEQVLGRLE